MTFIGVLFLLIIGVGGALFIEALKKREWKVALGVGVAVPATLAAFALLTPDSKPEAAPVEAPATTRPAAAAPQSVGVTLQNYRRQGDNIALECSGPPGSVVCTPKK